MDDAQFIDPVFWKSHHIVAKRCHYDDRMQRLTAGKSYKINGIFQDMIHFKDDLGYSNYYTKEHMTSIFNLKTVDPSEQTDIEVSQSINEVTHG
jgi:hypothetical protein